MTIEKAIRTMVEEYNRALNMSEELIDDPVSFAAYMAWRKAAEDYFKKMEKQNGKKTD